MYDIILFGDMPDRNTYSRASGSHRIGTELREHGYSVLVVDFSNYINIDKFSEIIDLAVGENTLGVGFSTTWFPFLLPDGSASNREPSKPAMRFNKAAENLSESLPVDFAGPHVEDYFDKVRSVNPKTKVILGGAKAEEVTHWLRVISII